MLKHKEEKTKVDESSYINRYGIGASISKEERLSNSLLYSTNIQAIDNIIGGKIPSGSMIEIHGDEASGKTLLSLEFIKDAQSKDKRVAIFDYDSNLNTEFAKKIGVDMSRLEIVRIPTAEDSLKLLYMMIESNQYGVIVVDSLPAMLPKKEALADYEDIDIRTQSKIINKFLFKVKPILDKSDTVIVFTNQTRSLLHASGYRTVGGRTFKSFMDIRISLKEKAKLAYNKEIIGIRVDVNIIKNTIYKSFSSAPIDIIFDYGIVKK